MAKPNGEFKIEKGVPVSKPQTGVKKGTTKYPFPEMEVGDSFFVNHSLERMCNAANKWKHATNSTFKFTTRKVAGGVRVWRIE